MTHRYHLRGFSVPEFMIVMTIMGVLSTVLIAMYGHAELSLSRGVTLTTLEQTARLTGARIIPKITSSVNKPADPDDPINPNAIPAILQPEAPDVDDENGFTGLPSDDQPWELHLNSIEPFVQRQLRIAETPFNPRQPAHLTYRIFFAVDTTRDQNDPNQAPDGRIGNVWLDANTPADTSDDVRVSANLHEVRFEREPDNVIRLVVVAKGWVKRAVGGRTLAERRYVTRVHLPIYTHTPGGT